MRLQCLLAQAPAFQKFFHMKELKQIYDRISFLRNSGVKMKDIAEAIGFSPSMLSSIYSTVLPSYFKNVSMGENEEEALDHALVWVNNVSKKKLVSALPSIMSTLAAMDDGRGFGMGADAGNSFLSAVGHGMAEAVRLVSPFCGAYMSYSISSNCAKMKMEPYLISLSEDGTYAEALHKSAYGVVHRGTVMMNGMSHIYICFNENPGMQLSLFYICLKIPMYDNPPFLRGLYMCLDYNSNPVARRILLVKMQGGDAAGLFKDMHGGMKEGGELDGIERKYYEYACMENDSLRLCNIPSPQMTADDLAAEKEMLESGRIKFGC